MPQRKLAGIAQQGRQCLRGPRLVQAAFQTALVQRLAVLRALAAARRDAVQPYLWQRPVAKA